MHEFVACPSCGHSNRMTARFCSRCGSPAVYTRPRERRFGIRRAVIPVAGVAAGGLLALGGWLAGWPPAVFSAAPAPSPPPAHSARQVAVHPSQTAASQTAAASQSASANVTMSAPAPTASPSRTVPTGPASTVEAYYAAINAKNYRLAWKLGGSSATTSYSEFAAGFSTTSKDAFTLISVSGDVVTGRLSALQSDGSTQVYEGTYTVSGNFITQFNVQQVSS